MSGGQNVALQAMKTLNIAIPAVEQWSDFARIMGKAPASARNFVPLVDVKALESIVRSEIKNRDIFAQALVSSTVVSLLALVLILLRPTHLSMGLGTLATSASSSLVMRF